MSLWVAAVDFKKAFDIWKATSKHGVPHAYVRGLRSCYEGQHGVVDIGSKSRRFKIERDIQQGDPLSPKLFKAVLQEAMGHAANDWEQ